jgi:acyl carrier protein
MNDLERKARDILGRHLKKDPSSLRPEDRLREDLGADSLDLIEVMFEFDETFGARISDERAVDLRTVGDVLQALQKGAAA